MRFLSCAFVAMSLLPVTALASETPSRSREKPENTPSSEQASSDDELIGLSWLRCVTAKEKDSASQQQSLVFFSSIDGVGSYVQRDFSDVVVLFRARATSESTLEWFHKDSDTRARFTLDENSREGLLTETEENRVETTKLKCELLPKS